MIQMSFVPERSLTKAMRVPSGDQAGCTSSPGSLVRRIWPLPSGFIA
jgi:hypothetical protein